MAASSSTTSYHIYHVLGQHLPVRQEEGRYEALSKPGAEDAAQSMIRKMAAERRVSFDLRAKDPSPLFVTSLKIGGKWFAAILDQTGMKTIEGECVEQASAIEKCQKVATEQGLIYLLPDSVWEFRQIPKPVIRGDSIPHRIL